MFYLNQAIDLWRLGKHREAQLLCESLVAENGNQADAVSLLAEIYAATAQSAEALRTVQQLATLRPNDAATHRRLGDALLAGGSHAAAAAAYRTSLSLDIRNVRAHNNLGQALMRLGEIPAAKQCFKQAIAYDSTYAIAHNNLGVLLFQLGEVDEAVTSYTNAIERDQRFVEAHHNLGQALMHLGRPLEALSRFDQAVAHRPASAELLVSRGNALHRIKRFEDALASHLSALQLKPGHVDALISCGAVLLDLKRPSEALKYCDAALQLQPDAAPAHSNRAGALLQLGRFEAALLACDHVISMDPASGEAHRNRGNILFATGNSSGASQCYERAIALTPLDAAAHNGLGRVRAEQGAFEQAAEHLRRATALDPELPEAHHNLGIVMAQLNRPEEALNSCARALHFDPDLLAAVNCCIAALLRLNRPEEALLYCNRAAQIRPDIADTHMNRCAVLRALNRPVDALACCDQALRICADLVEGHLSRGHILLEMSQHETALAAFGRALELKPDCLEAECRRGLILMMMADPIAAQVSFRRVLSVDSNHIGARNGLLLSMIPVIASCDGDSEVSRTNFANELDAFAAWVTGQTGAGELAIVGVTYPFFLAYQERANKALLVRYGTLCVQLMKRWALRQESRDPVVAPSDDGRIRVGIVTAHLRDHSVFHALTKGWLQQLDKTRVRISVFHLGAADQAVESSLQGTETEILQCGHWPLEKCVQALQDRHLEILIYPEVGMDQRTVQLASLRLATAQVAAWGHPETTGLSTIDYYLTAEAFEPSEAAEYYSEQLIRLPNLGTYYEPISPPAICLQLADFGISSDIPLLVCPGVPYKYAPEHDHIFVDIARELGRCQFVFFNCPIPQMTARLRERLERAFEGAGLAPARHLLFVPWLSPDEFLGLLQRATVFLDTLGFSGFNTTMQAIECDLPIVAHEGRFMRGRFASSIMRRIGIADLVASGKADYVRLAVSLARDADHRSQVSSRIRAAKHALFRDSEPISALMDFLTRRGWH
jgi:protein O-GlcNAc transferase